ncbi:MAG: bifunctional glutamate N-acetyltransferase/amino-acid acetyltransferase ArgJ [Phycisphaerales bacterium]
MTLLEEELSAHGRAALERAERDPLHRLPAGFVGSTASAAIKKPGRQDMALIACPDGATAAGVFTKNLVCAAPVQLSRRHLVETRGHASAVIINSGCANAATGAEGMARAVDCVDAVARELEVTESSVLVNSTGVIGVQLPTERMLPAIPEMVRALDSCRLLSIAQAIMTTDTYPKTAAVEIEHEGRRGLVCGIAKGAGMIHPDMAPPQATMISVLMTDAAVDSRSLQAMLEDAVDASFHRISIDGDTSTNDSVFVLASGKAGAFPEAKVAAALKAVARELALLVVRDGEGFERGIEVRVTGARTSRDALVVAKTIASSLLVRCAVTGGDPNWGRIVAAAGRAGVPLSVDDLTLTVGGVDLFRDGAPAATPLAERERVFRAPLVEITLDLGQGSASDEFFSCGLTEAYVRLNAEYTT